MSSSRYSTSPRWPSTPDGALAICVYAAVLLLIPATQVLPGLRGIGTIAHIVAWLLLLWWIAEWLAYRQEPLDPVSKAMGAFFLVALVSYAVGMSMPLHDDQVRAADRGLITIVTGLGVALVTAQGVRTQRQLDTVFAVLVCLGGIVAVIALVQFATGFDIGSAIKVPLLNQTVSNAGPSDIRFGFTRANATAAHPIELGVILAVLAPLGLHLTVLRGRLWIAVPTAAMIVAIPTTLARSGFIALAIGLLCVMPAWTWLERLTVLAVMGALGLLAVVLRPGLGEGIVDLFTQAGTDDSVLGRTSDYGAIGGYLNDSPLFGSGMGTFLPSRFIILDNQFLLTLIDMGIVGLLALFILVGTAVSTALGIYLDSTNFRLSRSAGALAASVIALVVSLSFFDALSFDMVTGVMWLLIGLAGATWRIARTHHSEV